METTIKKKIKGSVMEQIFESSKTVNVRYYETLKADHYDENESYFYKITIRHSEDENPRELINQAIKEII